MKDLHCVGNHYRALPLLVLCLCATTSQAQDVIMKDLTPGSQVGTETTIATKIGKYAGVFGACSLLDTTITSSNPNSDWHKIYPGQAVARYLHRKSDVGFDYKVRLITPPSLGSIRDYSQNPYTHKDGFVDNTSFEYIPDESKFPRNSQSQYLGKDRAIFEVEHNGKLYKVVYDLHVVGVIENAYLDGSNKKCRYVDPVNSWRIGSEDLNTIITDGDATEAWLATSNSFSSLAAASGVTIMFDNLAGTAVGQATGTNITLDTNAAGHGWFVDTTPDNNEEFLATSDPNVWIARAGSAADGKMDMLSVLMHEYGHVLGLDHSADNGDAMSAVLQPGVRKLWSETYLAKLNEIIYL